MYWIVFTVFFTVLFWIGIGLWVGGKETPEGKQERERDGRPPLRRIGELLAVGSAVIWVAVSLGMMFHNVGQREVAIVYNFSGTISGKKDAGTIVTMPYQHIKKENIGIRHNEWTFGKDNSAVSIDQQKITALVAVNYQIDPAQVVDLYKRVGPSWKTIIIDSRVPQVFKETTATYTTPELTAKREQLRIDTKKRLTAELKPYDIEVVDVFVKNLGFSDTYTGAIEAKQKQVQDALTAQAKVAQVTAEANQKIAEAKGEATANVERARGDATANKLRQQSLTPLLVQQLAIEKLNPQVTVVYCAPNILCIPNANVVPVTKP
jgi:regulator of protease activity HflC (stomatin/prohibitin superfamily)